MQMSILDAFQTGEHARNLAYFNALVNLAQTDGVFHVHEKKMLKVFMLLLCQKVPLQKIENLSVHHVKT